MHENLIDAAALKARLDAGQPTLILDCRFDLADTQWGPRVHREGSLPGAIHVDLDQDLSGPIPPKGESRTGGRHPLPSMSGFRDRMSWWGVRPETQVVAFDDRGGPFAARAWWMLRAAGHPRVAVLDGGIGAWRELGGPVPAGRRLEGEDRRPELAIYEMPWPGTRSAEELLAQLDELCIFDARAARRYSGEVEPLDHHGGHIPGSRSLPFSGNLDAKGKLLARAELRERFEASFAGCEPASRVASCGSGVTACHNLLAMSYAGLGDADLYAGSWSDWISDEARPRSKGPT
jgi:thiosulfate/3-mercaptopyruvate sulfurtransferase